MTSAPAQSNEEVRGTLSERWAEARTMVSGGKMQRPADRSQRALRTNPAITYSRSRSYYHWPWKLNGRVRNGNGCDLPGKVTGKIADYRFPIVDSPNRKSAISNRQSYVNWQRQELWFVRKQTLEVVKSDPCHSGEAAMSRSAETAGADSPTVGSNGSCCKQSKGSMRSSVWLLVPVS